MLRPCNINETDPVAPCFFFRNFRGQVAELPELNYCARSAGFWGVLF